MAAPAYQPAFTGLTLDPKAPSSGTVFESAARTASPNPIVIGVPENAQSLIVVLNVTAITANTATVLISGVDRSSNTIYTILQSAATGAAQVIMRVSPHLTGSANLIAKDILPAEIQIGVTNSDTGSITYSVSAHFTA